MEHSFEVPTREGVRVYVGEQGDICLAQQFSDLQEEEVVILHPDIVEQTIEFMRKAVVAARCMGPKEPEEQQEPVTTLAVHGSRVEEVPVPGATRRRRKA